MKNKTPLVLGGIFVVLVIIYFITSYNPPEVSEGAEPVFPPGNKPDITSIEFAKPDNETIVLTKRQDGWYITEPIEYKALDMELENMLTDLLDMKVDAVISRREEARETYNVDASSGIRMQAFEDGETVLDVVIGRYSTDMTHTYVRPYDSDEIVIWRGLFDHYARNGTDDWRDRSVYTFNAGDIVSIEAVEDGVTRRLSLPDSVWTYTENGAEKEISQNRARQLAEHIASLKADAFANENDMNRVVNNDPDVHVSFRVRNGNVHEYDLWTPEEGAAQRYLLRKKDGDIVFRFHQYRGPQLVVPYDRLEPQS